MQANDALNDIINVLPRNIGGWVRRQKLDSVIEIVLDIGAEPELRYVDDYTTFEGYKVTENDIDVVLHSNTLGKFNYDNRTGIKDTLHRISAIRDQHGDIVGLTMRVGKPLDGCVRIIQDLIDSGESILLLGRPGIGKTSKLRDSARYLSDTKRKRVVIVDTSNEIAGDGVTPHSSVGRARRMMIPPGRKQSDMMVEAVKNHTPHVVVIDEISTFAEAKAARTIAERGVQLLATAHGNTLDNLVVNDELTILIGSVNAVTRGDKYADKHGTSKTQIERKTMPTFTKIVELIDFNTVAIHHDTVQAVDCLLLGGEAKPEIRTYDKGRVIVEQASDYSIPDSPTPKSVAEPRKPKPVYEPEDREDWQERIINKRTPPSRGRGRGKRRR